MSDTIDIQKHLKDEHGKNYLTKNLKEVVYGGIDGIVTTFAVVAGFSGAQAGDSLEGVIIPVGAVLIFGVANLLADGFSMGVGDYLSSRAEAKQYQKERNKELQDIENQREYEYKESLQLLMEEGMSASDAEKIMSVYSRYPDIWADFMMTYELEMDRPEDNPLAGAFVTFFSFLFFGSIPLIPYLLKIKTDQEFFYSCIFSSFALVLLGLTRSYVTKEKKIVSTFEIWGLGGVAALIAYFVGVWLG